MLIHLLEEWRANLDQNRIIRAFLLDLSKAIDCIPIKAIKCKLNTYAVRYGSSETHLLLFETKETIFTHHNIYRNFLELLTGVPQGSILGSLLFNIFPNVLFLSVTKSFLHNYADDNTLCESFTDVVDQITNEISKSRFQYHD